MQKKQKGGVLHITTTSKGYLREPSTLIHQLDPTVGTLNFGIPHIGNGSWRVDMADSNQPTGAASVRIERLPISTAPRDGSIVKMQQRNFSPFHARWVHGAGQPIEYRHGLPATHWLKEIADG